MMSSPVAPITPHILNLLIQLLTLCSITLAVSYGTVYWRAFRKDGWGSCSQGFTRYARDMFWQSLALSLLFGVWGLRRWLFPPEVPLVSTFLGPITFLSVVILLFVMLDIIRDRLVSRTPPHWLFWTAAGLITVGNLAALVFRQ